MTNNEFATRAAHRMGHHDIDARRPELDLAARIAAERGRAGSHAAAKAAATLTLARVEDERHRMP